MSKENIYQARVTAKLPNHQFKVEKDNGETVRCVTKGHIRQNDIRIVIGDVVKVEDVAQSDIDRITYRVT